MFTRTDISQARPRWRPSFLTVLSLAGLAIIIAMAPGDAKASTSAQQARLCRHVYVAKAPHRMPLHVCYGLARSRMPVRWIVNYQLHELLRRESAYDPCAVNPGHHGWCWYTGSSACGLGQFYPCRCLHHGAVRPQGDCVYDYIKGRYGNPAAALAYHDAHGSY